MTAATDFAEKIALVNLLSVEGIGSATVLRLVERCGSAQAVFAATDSELRGIPRLNPELMAKIRSVGVDGEPGRKELERAGKLGVELRSFWDENYPPALRNLERDAPALLYVRGSFPPEALRLAVVGTRSATAYGKRMTRELILGLRGSGVRIVSGLASGIDGLAHEAALEAGLPTEAVFGCGVDRIYPAVHAPLAERMLTEGGALISEFPLGSDPERHHFPQRNRIIAGLAQATLVTEAGDRSGALITAHLAVEYGREVAAVPGAVTNPRAHGTNALIKTGAALVETPEDILELLRVRPVHREAVASSQLPIDLPESESALVQMLDPTEPLHIDAIAQRSGLAVGDALGKLLLLELKGTVKQLPGKYFVRA